MSQNYDTDFCEISLHNQRKGVGATLLRRLLYCGIICFEMQNCYTVSGQGIFPSQTIAR